MRLLYNGDNSSTVDVSTHGVAYMQDDLLRHSYRQSPDCSFNLEKIASIPYRATYYSELGLYQNSEFRFPC